MPPKEESLCQQIALGWTLELALQAMMLGFMIIDSILMDDNFSSLRHDPGPHGAKVLVFPIALYALMPVYVYLVHGIRPRVFRWLAVAVAVLGFLFYILHHLSHWVHGQRPDLSSNVFDITLHLMGLWVVVNSIRWARYRPANGASLHAGESHG
jgi:hypothetical protein